MVLTILALGLGMSAVEIWTGGEATAREAMVYSLFVGAGLVMLLNLNRHGRAEEVERQRIEAEIRRIMDLAGPAAYSGERRR